MRGARHDGETLLAGELLIGIPIQLENNVIVSANDEQRGGSHADQYLGASQIRPAAARDNGANPLAEPGRGDERCRAAGAGTEATHAQSTQVALRVDPARCMQQTFGEQRDVEAVLARVKVRLLFGARE